MPDLVALPSFDGNLVWLLDGPAVIAFGKGLFGSVQLVGAWLRLVDFV